MSVTIKIIDEREKQREKETKGGASYSESMGT